MPAACCRGAQSLPMNRGSNPSMPPAYTNFTLEHCLHPLCANSSCRIKHLLAAITPVQASCCSGKDDMGNPGRKHDNPACAAAAPEACVLAWMVAVSPSKRMISPIRESAPTRTSSYIALPDMWSATTTGPETLRIYLGDKKTYRTCELSDLKLVSWMGSWHHTRCR